ncbi:MAG: magnesium chelatase subunit D [Pseudomonadota bacterium]
MTDRGYDPWRAAKSALTLVAVDPIGLGGVWLRAQAGPARDRWRAALAPALAPLPVRRIATDVSEEQLSGGLDLAATLAAGRPVRDKGLLAEPVLLVLPMAERASAQLAARLGMALDDDAAALVALDEGAATDEAAPSALADRLAFQIDLDGLRHVDALPFTVDAEAVSAARDRLPDVKVADDAMKDLTVIAVRLGVDSLRAPILALRTAKAACALAGRTDVSEEDLALSAQLVLAPRALVVPDEDVGDDDTPAPDTPEENSAETDDQRSQDIPSEILLDAVKSALPPDVLDRLSHASTRANQSGAGHGASRRSAQRGRPLPSRRGRLDGRSRIDLTATLRAAAPWQPLRRQETPNAAQRVLVRGDDIRLRRREDRTDRLLVFAVDASGSTALARLAEAKGAVEILLANAYAKRDHVALIAFRGDTAETLLPPTRSLTRAKRCLSGLPGGGATPLAAGLQAALEQTETARRRGMSPSLILLTDGRANIALDGTADRSKAGEDAQRLGRVHAANGTSSIVIDASRRPQAPARDLAASLDAEYLPLPRADARGLSAAVTSAMSRSA